MGLGLQPNDETLPTYKTSEQAHSELPIYGGPDKAMLDAGYAPVSFAPQTAAPAPSRPVAPAPDQSMIDAGYTPVSFYQPPTDDRSNFNRGLQTSWEQLKQTGAGSVALVGDTFGLDGLKNWGLEKYQSLDENVKGLSHENDDIFNALSKDGSFTDWLGYASGYTLGQAVQVLAGGGIGAAVGKALLGKAAQKVAAGMIERKVGELTTEQLIGQGLGEVAAKEKAKSLVAQGLISDAIKEKAVAYTAQIAGASIATFGMNASQELGSIYGSAVEEQGKTGQPISLPRIWAAGIGAAGLDTVVDMGALGRALSGTAHGANPIARIAKSATAQALKEAGTEGVQTIMERWGAQQSLADTESLHDVINSMAMGALGGSMAGGVAGLHGRSKAAQIAREQGNPNVQTNLAGLPEADVGQVVPGSRGLQQVPALPAPSDNVAYQNQTPGLTPTTPTEEESVGQQHANEVYAARFAEETRRGLYAHLLPNDATVVSAADDAAARIQEGAKADDLPSVKAGIAELVGNAQKALDSIHARPDIYATLGQAQAALDSIAEKQKAQPKTAQAPAGAAVAPTVASSPIQPAPIAPAAPTQAAPVIPSAAAPVADAGGPSPPPAPAPGPAATLPPAGAAAVATSQRLAAAPVAPTTPEPQGDIQAQIAAMVDPNNPKDSVFIAKGTTVPEIPKGVAQVSKPEGLYLTTNFPKALAIKGPQSLTDDQVATFLGLPEPKSQTGAAPLAVQGKDAAGNVASGAIISSPSSPNVAAVAAQTPAGGSVTITDPVTAQNERTEKISSETAPQAQTMSPLVTDAGATDATTSVAPAAQAAPTEAAPGAAPAGARKVNAPIATAPTLEVPGIDYNDEPATLKVWAEGGKIQRAELHNSDGSSMVVSTKRNDTIQNVVSRLSDEFTPSGEQRTAQSMVESEMGQDNPDDEPMIDDGPPDSVAAPTTTTTQKQNTPDMALKALRRSIRKAGKKVAARAILPNAPISEREAFVNEQLAARFGTDHSVTLTETPDKWKAMAIVVSRLVDQKIQFFVPMNNRINDATDGFVVPGDPDTIYVSVNNQKPAMFIFGHEIGHNIGQLRPKLWASFMEEVRGLADKKEFASYLHRLKLQLEDEASQMGETRPTLKEVGATTIDEVSADAVGTAFMDKDFWNLLLNSVAPEKKPLVVRVMEEMAAYLKQIVRALFPSVREQGVAAGTIKPGAQEEHQMFSDVRNLHRAVRDLIVDYREIGPERLTAAELKSEAATFFDEKMEPDTAAEYPEKMWADLSQPGKDYWVEMYDLYRSGDIDAKELIREFDHVQSLDRKNAKDTAAVGQLARSNQYHDAERLWDEKLATKNDPDFADLAPDHKNHMIRRVYDNANGKTTLGPTDAYRDIIGWRKQAEEGLSEQQKALDQKQAKDAAAKAATEAKAAKEAADVKARQAKIDALVKNQMPAIMQRLQDLSPRDQEIIAKHFNKAAYTDAVARYFTKQIADVLVDPKNLVRTMPADIRPVVRRIIGGEIKYSRIANGVDAVPVSPVRKKGDHSLIPLLYGKRGESETLAYTIPKRPNKRAFAEAMQNRTRQILGGQLDLARDGDRALVADAMAREAMAAMKKKPGAARWYRHNLTQAINTIGKVYPEILTNPTNRAMFTLALALTSNGKSVDNNLNMATRSYEHYRAAGRLLPIGEGKESAVTVKSFNAANEFIDRYGADHFAQFLNTEFRVSQMKRMGLDAGGESADNNVYGSAMFGPKIGAAFFQNLNGNFQTLTMDRWFMRTIGRLTGSLVVENEKLLKDQADRFRSAFSKASPAELARFGLDIADQVKIASMSDDDLLTAADKVHNLFIKQKYVNSTEMAAAARTWTTTVDETLDQPTGAEHRNQIRDVVSQALTKFNEGVQNPIEYADFQALIWFPEKDLYLNHNATSKVAEPTDYAKAAQRFVDARGAGAVGPASGLQAQSAASGRVRSDALSESEKRKILRTEIARQFTLDHGKRDEALSPYQSPRAYRAGNRGSLEADVRPSKELRPHVIQSYLPDVSYRNAMAQAGVSTPSYHELAATPEAAALFRDKLLAAQKSQGAAGAQVTVYDAVSTPEQDGYDRYRLFLTSDGRAGFTIKPDGEIGSVFKTVPGKGSVDDLKYSSVSMLHAATQMGGRWLNAFDTYLPDEYAIAGFKPVSRIPFNREFAPNGWNYKAQKGWNNGEPDVVWMAYDDGDPTLYERGAGTKFRGDQYDNAEALAKNAAQPEALRGMRGRILYSRKDLLNPVEVYAMKGDKIVGMASYNVPQKTWFVYKSQIDIRDDPNYTQTSAATTEEALNALREKGVRLMRRKESPLMQGQHDVWGRGPDALYDIDTSPLPANNHFTKAVDAIIKPFNLDGPALRRKLTWMMQDSFIDLKALQADITRKGGFIDGSNNVYQKITLFPGATGAKMDAFRRQFVDPMERRIEAAMKKGATLKDVEKFLAAQHAKERNDMIFTRTQGKIADGSGITAAEAAQRLRDYRAMPYASELQEIGQIADDISTFKVDLMESSGLISHDDAEGLRTYKHYRPLKGLDEDDSGEITGGMGVGTGFSGKGTLLKYALGRDTEATHIVSHLLLDAEAKIIRAGKNVVSLALAKLAEDHPDLKFWSVNEMKARRTFNPETGAIRYQVDNDFNNPNVVMAYRDGVPIKIDLKNDDFAQSITNAKAMGSNGLIEGLRRWNKYLAMAMTSLNPEWALVNAARDAQTAYFNVVSDTKLPPGMANKSLAELAALKGHRDIYRAITDPNNDLGLAKWYKELEAEGGITKFFGLETLKDRADKMMNLEERLQHRGIKGKLLDLYTKSHAEAMIQWIEDVNSTIEAAPRVIIYKNLRLAGWSKADAADYAKNLTVNFNRKGAQQNLSSLYLFFNPAVQGTARLWEAVKSPAGQMVAGSLFAAGFAASLIGNSAGDDDKNGIPDYQQLSDWERSTNIILWPHGPKIPLPYGWNAFYAMGNYLADTFYGRSPMSAAWAGFKPMVNAFNPIGGADSKTAAGWLTKQITPTIMQPALGLAMNENRYGSQIARTQDSHFGPKMPNSQMGSMSATAMSKGAANLLNRATNGSAGRAGGLDINPDTIDFIFQSVFPGVISTAARSVSTVSKMAAGEPTESKDYPGVRRVWTEPSKGKIAEALTDAKTKIGELQNMAKNGDASDRTDLTKNYPGWGGVAAGFSVWGKQVGDLQKRKAAIIDGKIKVADETAEKKRLDDRIQVIQNKMLSTYNATSSRW